MYAKSFEQYTSMRITRRRRFRDLLFTLANLLLKILNIAFMILNVPNSFQVAVGCLI